MPIPFFLIYTFEKWPGTVGDAKDATMLHILGIVGDGGDATIILIIIMVMIILRSAWRQP